MKHLITACFLLLTVTLSANNFTTSNQNPPQVGDKLVINKHTGETYKHINFPRLNIVVKRGGIASYNSVTNAVVIVEDVTTDKNGDQIISLKREDGRKFFGFLNTVKADYSSAINSGELSKHEN